MILAFCDKSYIVEILLIIKTIFKIACYITPLLVIIVSMIHIFKSVLNGKEEDLKDSLKVTVKRIIAGLLIAFFPALINYVFTGLLDVSEVEFLSCFESASKEKVANLKAKEEAEAEAERKAQEKQDEAELRKAWEAEQKKKGAKKQSFEEWKKEQEANNNNNNSNSVPSSGNTSFNLEHAINVGESIHTSENGHLKWQGETINDKGGTIGAYEEAINIFNGTDYHIYEVYDVLVKAHPELKDKHIEPYELEDMNNYYHFSVTRAEANINEVDNALNAGKLVQLQVHSDKWRNSKGEHVSWPGYHSGLIFYFDGTHYHMKAAGKINQKNAIYTREQLIDWIGGTSKRLVIYTKQ